jgi:hypothetical protein
MKRISENGARPVPALGQPPAEPIGRLGALVFQPITRIRLCWASLWAQTRIAGCAQAQGLRTPAGKTFCSEIRRWESLPAIRRREGMAPVGAVKVLLATCPRALLRSTLTAPTSATDAPLRIAGIDLLAAKEFGQ